MFNVLIVDDNKIVLEGLTKFVNWTELGYKVVGVATSVIEALSIIENEYVDVILSDVVMPKKTGFDLIKEALQINPIIKTIILSSFGEFKYAQEAMRLGAYDYLVKPVNFEELERVFNSLKGILEDEILEKQRLGDFRAITHAQFLNNLVNGFFYNAEIIKENAHKIGFELIDGDICIVRLLLNGDLDIVQNVNGQDYTKNIMDISEKTYSYLSNYGKVEIFNNQLYEIGVLFYPNAPLDLKNVLGKFAKYIKSVETQKVYLGVGSIYHNLIDISKSFVEASKALEYRDINKETTLFYFEQCSKKQEKPTSLPNIQEKQMGLVVENVINYINKHYNEKLTLEKLSDIAFVHPIYLSTLFKEKSGENFVEYLTKVRIEHSKALLTNLSYRIYDVCQMVGYDSPRHFSKVFKENTGMTPKEYRNKLQS